MLTVQKREEHRLEAQHEILYQFAGNKTFFPRIDHPRKILDCGYGRGDWVVQVAEEHEQCEVRRGFRSTSLLSNCPGPLFGIRVRIPNKDR